MFYASEGEQYLGLRDKTYIAWHKAEVSLRAERSNLCPNTEIASSRTAPRNDSLVSSAPLFVQSFVSVMLRGTRFTDIEVKPTWGYWNIVTGRKPFKKRRVFTMP